MCYMYGYQASLNIQACNLCSRPCSHPVNGWGTERVVAERARGTNIYAASACLSQGKLDDDGSVIQPKQPMMHYICTYCVALPRQQAGFRYGQSTPSLVLQHDELCSRQYKKSTSCIITSKFSTPAVTQSSGLFP
jgi:hypothetical protein